MGGSKYNFFKTHWVLGSLIMLRKWLLAICELEHRDAVPSSGKTLLQRDTCWEAWLSTGKRRLRNELWCTPGTRMQGQDPTTRPVPPPTFPVAFPLLLPLLKQARAPDRWNWGGGMMASAQRWGLRLLKNRAASRRRPGVSRQSNTTQFVCVCACKLKRNVMRVYEIKTCHLSIPSF